MKQSPKNISALIERGRKKCSNEELSATFPHSALSCLPPKRLLQTHFKYIQENAQLWSWRHCWENKEPLQTSKAHKHNL